MREAGLEKEREERLVEEMKEDTWKGALSEQKKRMKKTRRALMLLQLFVLRCVLVCYHD